MESETEMMILEQQVRDDFRIRWDGWLETYQPTRGSGEGVPDCQIKIGDGLFPIEIKRAAPNKNGFKLSAIRASQVSWHKRFLLAGGKSFFVTGVLTAKGEMLRFISTAEYMLYRQYDPLNMESDGFVRLPIGPQRKTDLVFSDAVRKFILETPFQIDFAGA